MTHDSKQLCLPHRVVRPGSRWTEQDLAFVQSLLNQRRGLDQSNRHRQERAATRRLMVRWNYELVKALNPDEKKETLIRLVQRWANISSRQIDRDLAATDKPAIVEWARREVRSAATTNVKID